MATRFAIASTNWNTPATWDNGAVPVAGDTVYPNGFTVPIDTDISVASLNNNISPVAIPNIATPAMTSNTQPNGTVISSNSSGTAYVCFNQDNSTSNFWSSGVASTGWIGYTFPSAKVIKRYIIKISSTSQGNPKTWTFEGSNDGFATAGVQLDQVLSYTTNANYTSVLLANTTAYTSYRVNVTAVQGASTVLICELEMTESTTASPVYGTTTGGSFTVPASLSGTRNIVQTGSGIFTNISATVLSLAHTGTNIVNLNTVSGGYIINPNFCVSSVAVTAINFTGTGILNINGDFYGNQGISSGYGITSLATTAASTVNIIGNLYSPRISSSLASQTILCSAAGATFNITGNIVSTSNAYGAQYNNQWALYTTQSNVTINIIGNVTGDQHACVYNAGATGIINVTGIITVVNSSSVYAIGLPSFSSLLTASTPIINKGTANAVFAHRIRLNNAYSSQWVMQDQTNATRTLYNGTGTLGMPLTTNVRYGTVYGQSSEYTGDLRVPNPNTVALGVLTDNTTGTAVLTAEDFLNAISTSSNVIATRLKNVSTVQTTGDQMSSFNV